jgi:ornithine cyclodeaminase/alanine dehydrogenase-like protein (mu-crystallin family)
MQHLDSTATARALPLPALVDALRSLFASGCTVPQRHVHEVPAADGTPAGTVLLMPAWRPGGRLGIKTVNVFPGNAALGKPALHAVYTLFDARTGEPLAQLDGDQITARRTVAASALAASYLARADATRLLVVGAGRVARLVPEAMRAVRPGAARGAGLEPSPAGAQALAQQWRDDDGIDAVAVTDLEAAVRQADIVSCATLSTAGAGAGRVAAARHACRPGRRLHAAMREADGECLRRARVWVDTAEAMAKAGDLLQAVAEGAFDAARCRARWPICAAASAPGAWRPTRSRCSSRSARRWKTWRRPSWCSTAAGRR